MTVTMTIDNDNYSKADRDNEGVIRNCPIKFDAAYLVKKKEWLFDLPEILSN